MGRPAGPVKSERSDEFKLDVWKRLKWTLVYKTGRSLRIQPMDASTLGRWANQSQVNLAGGPIRVKKTSTFEHKACLAFFLVF